jgi:hypothetical protein
MPRLPLALVLLVLPDAVVLPADETEEWISGIKWAEPPRVTPGENGGPPSDAIVLFDGKDLSQWEGGDLWLVEDGYAEAREERITSRQKFGDCQLHLEFATPAEVEGAGQGRGNSGVFLMDHYELQILDSWDNPTYCDGQCGAIYKQRPPLVNASKRPGEWQTFDILFTAPRFNDDGSLKSRGAITVLHNGVVVQHHFELLGKTAYDRPPINVPHAAREPIRLQFHKDSVRFRNIWVRDLERRDDG